MKRLIVSTLVAMALLNSGNIMTALLVAPPPIFADEISDFLDGPPYPGGLPKALELLAGCDAQRALLQAELDVFNGEITVCEETILELEDNIQVLQDALFLCEATSQGLPGDGVTGAAQDYSSTGNTVLDVVTGLEWLKKNLDSGSPHFRDTLYTYAQAEQWVADLNAANVEGGGWRLPNVMEAQSIHDYSPGLPCIDAIFGDVGRTVATNYWTSTPTPISTSQRRFVDYGTCNGSVTTTTATLRAIAVR